MKKVKLLVVILVSFFAFGIQSASAQYVDVTVAKGLVIGKINDISKEMETAKDVGGENLYYQLATKYGYYNQIMIAFKHQKTVAEALDETQIASSSADTPVDVPTALLAVLDDKQFNLSLREEAEQLLKN